MSASSSSVQKIRNGRIMVNLSNIGFTIGYFTSGYYWAIGPLILNICELTFPKFHLGGNR